MIHPSDVYIYLSYGALHLCQMMHLKYFISRMKFIDAGELASHVSEAQKILKHILPDPPPHKGEVCPSVCTYRRNSILK